MILRNARAVKMHHPGFTRSPAAASVAPKRNRNLAADLVESLGDRIRDGRLAAGAKLPTEAAIMVEYGVSRTVVREALSKLQAAGQVLTRHGIGTFVVGPGETAPFRIAPEQLATLDDVIAMLELRIGLETEAAALAAQRRSDANLRQMRAALADFSRAIEGGQDAVGADFRFHLEIARATQNSHYAELMAVLGRGIIPRARLDAPVVMDEARRDYLRRVNSEHDSILDAIARHDAEAARAAMRTHLANSRERRRRVRDSTGGRPATAPVKPAATRRKDVVR
jgi:DNA-binding FadR family transcriptional regulator